MENIEKIKESSAYIVKHTGSHYILAELPTWNLFPAVIKGKLRLKESYSTNPVAVGDIVEYQAPLDENANICDTATIKSVLERKNYIIRKSTNLSRQSHIIAANIDMAYLVVTLDFPETKWAFIDRFLVSCEAYKIPVTILINKIDFYTTAQMREGVEYFKQVYEHAGYRVLEVSAKRGDGVDELRRECALPLGEENLSLKENMHKCNVRINLFSGVSGVGKSSLIKALDPSLDPKVGQISTSHLQGKHTTTFYEMYPLSTGGYIVDTPGIRGFGIVDVEKEELSTYFPDMLRVMDGCRFKPCTHTHEPGCAVKDALENGDISAERYASYLGMLEDESKYR